MGFGQVSSFGLELVACNKMNGREEKVNKGETKG